ncbi:leucine-rich repeat protein [Finegoldia sp. BIOML-A2]|uniref:leucine-rich repeat protein n=1 Tax=unclassified Finegoldia TaxID=2619637 RepID=UPI0012AFFB7D|nr:MULTISPECIES: leucine-rich repeat protein [unclassified Finegoldia]MSA97999.1 leucine-rich repeat protein [Finegoldia sp. BIOML-A5]MSB01377.1 leucine-rich repeat protein [Finegoldia sp. BIOML-A2]
MKNKRIVSWILIFAMVIGFAPVNIYASDVPQKQEVTAENDFNFDTSTGTIIKYKGTAADVVIPEKINGKTVTTIGKGAFGRKKLTSVVIPEGVETIGEQAFMGNLFTSIKLPSTVKKIDNQAFMANKNLKTINFPDSLKTIGHSIFMGDKALEGELTLGANLELLDRFTFGNITKSSSQSVKLNIAPGKTKLTILRGTFGSEQSNVDIPLERPILIKANAFKTEKPVTLNFGTIEVQKGISKEELANTLKQKVLLNLLIAENDYRNMSELGKKYELPIDWKLNSVDTNSNGVVKLENSFLYDEEKVKSALNLNDEGYSAGDIDEILGRIKVVGKLSFKEEAGQPEEPSEDESKFVASDFTYGQFKYKGRMEEESYRFGITGFSEKGKAKLSKNPDLVIPKEVTIDGKVKQVEGIKENSFKDIKINSVIFPKSDVEFIIKDSAFQNSGLTKVKFEEGLKSIESYAFKNNKLTEVSIPSTVWKTGSESFMNNEISNLEISDDVEMIQIDNYSFANNKLSLVKLPYSIFKFRDFVFKDNPGYENKGIVRLETRNPDHLKSTTYIIPENKHHKVVLVTDVNRSELFKELQAVKSIVREDYKKEALVEFDKVLEEAKAIFKDEKSTQKQVNKALDDLIEAEGNLRKSAPDRSKLRDSIKKAEELIPEMFEKESFNSMKEELVKAKEVLADLNKTADEVKAAQENLDKALDKLVINENALYKKEDFTYKDNAITGFSKSGKTKFKINKNLVLPDTTLDGKDIEVIAESAFDLIKDEGVKFGTDTVSSANGMTSLELPKKLKRIENYAFRVNNFKNVELPDTLEYIGGSAFNGNRLEKVYLPDSVTKVEGGAFSLNQITELRISPNMEKIAGGTFSRNIKLQKLVIPEGVKVIEGSAFQGAPLKQLTISKTVEEIKDRAFTGHQLEELTIPGNVKKIERQAFAHNIKWKRLKKLTLEEGIEEIGDSAFRFSLLKETNLPKSLKKLSDDAFKDAESTDKKHVVVNLYTENYEHVRFNNEKSLKNQKVIFKGEFKPGIIEEIPAVKAEDIEKEVVKQGEKIDVTDNIKNLPEKATVKDVTEPKIDTNKPGKYTAKVELIFANGSKRIVEIPVVVEKKDTTQPEKPVEPKEPEDSTQPTTPTYPSNPTTTTEKPTAKDIKDTDTLKEIFDKTNPTRIAGRNRQLTAVELSKTLFKKADTVILTSSNKMVDSLAASPRGIGINAPTLFVEKDSIMDEVLQEITRLNPSKIIIAGGTDSISDEALNKLQQLGIKQQRIAGADRFETAVKLGEQIRSNSTNKKEIILVNGFNNIDALTAGSLASKLNIPILLTQSDQLNETTKKAIKEWGIEKVTIIGGKTQVSETITANLQNNGIKTNRLAGRTRVETALEIAKTVNSTPDKVIFANKDAYADALLAPYLSKKEQAPIMLIDKGEASVSVKQYLRDNEIKESVILGGQKSIE